MSSLTILSPPQQRGAHPGGNAWMSASAGTGKTQVLTARIKRLLLQGVPPHAILAITFTRAGAAEMARRVRKDMADWVRMDGKALSKELFAIGDEQHLDEAHIGFARTLFAKVIDAPGGGLAIQTIHSFCQTLLAGFPEEAGLAPGFRALEETEIGELRGEVLGDLVTRSEKHDPALGDRIRELALRFDEGTLRAYLDRCAGAANALEALPAGIAPWLRGAFGLPSSGTPDAWLAGQCGDDSVDARSLAAIADCCAAWTSAKAGPERAFAIRSWLARTPEWRAATIGDLFAVFATAKGEMRKDWSTSRALGSVTDLAVRLFDRLAEIIGTHTHMAAADRLADGLEVGRAFARAVADRKRREGLVDLDDLIRMTAELLATPGRAEWIRYKLDTRIDHILVDEAQDTNEAQWRIVWALAEEFFAGAGAKDGETRTLFVVGDYKQAIYGFQGTSPENFSGARKRFFLAAAEAERPFADVPINENFRSSPPVLEIVDEVISRLGTEALGEGVPDVRHLSSVPGAPGRVVLWPAVPAPVALDDEEDAGEEGWLDSATRTLAGKIASSVRLWIDEGIDGEEVHPRDVMILVRKRTDLAGLIVSRLQAAGVPVAGVDRLQLKVPIVVQDLLAAARFALQPLDSLSLGSLLVSPLMGWSHDELIEHGWRQNSEGRSGDLWPHLNKQADANDLLPSGLSIAPLKALLNMAGNVTPHRFFETILSGPMRGRAKLLARLGNASLDPVEELVSKALDYQTRHGASLHGFLAAFDRGDVEIKREMDSDADQVRVMTVHGSKGLQAKIVILADATGDPGARKERGLDWPGEAGKVPLLPVKKSERPEVLARVADALAEQEMQEHWRLLYVAMTRAERMLFVAGALGKRMEEPPEDSWYAAIQPVVEELGEGWEPTTGGVWPLECGYVVSGREPRLAKERAVAASVAIPDWARAPAPVEPRPLRPLAPSALGEKEALDVPQPPVAPHAPGLAAERGVLMHALFERLPPVAAGERREAGERWLERAGAVFDADARGAMLDAVLAVLDDPAHAALFGSGSLAEVPFSALVGGRVVAGSMDRLLVTDDAVRVVDYKTGVVVPSGAGDVPVGYLRQMAAYAGALAVIFPEKRLAAALLFTGGPLLIDLPPELLDAHKPGLGEPKAISGTVA